VLGLLIVARNEVQESHCYNMGLALSLLPIQICNSHAGSHPL
jgi:hypothetical protein